MVKSGKQGALVRSKAKQEIFRMEDIPMNWIKMRRVGAGLANLGNTCFMNSVLQCLLHTPPLAELLLSEHELAPSGGTNVFDPISMTRKLLKDSLGSRQGFVAPQLHARTLKRINRSFRLGRQEDAHEYLIALLDAMHERSITGMKPKPSSEVEFTSFIYRIFGGRIRSQVKCTECEYESNTYDPFLDLSLEITHARSVERALQHFTEKEVLDGSNKYRCPSEKRPVRAIKRMTVEIAPRVLIIQLKRFQFSLSGRKISKPIEFSNALDLSPYMSHRPKSPIIYDLFGVLVHQGHSMYSGHYFCYIKGAGGGGNEWHKFDDTRVHPTSYRNVLGQQPYLLFYIRRQGGVELQVPRHLSSKKRVQGNPGTMPEKDQSRTSDKPQNAADKEQSRSDPKEPSAAAAAAAPGAATEQRNPVLKNSGKRKAVEDSSECHGHSPKKGPGSSTKAKESFVQDEDSNCEGHKSADVEHSKSNNLNHSQKHADTNSGRRSRTTLDFVQNGTRWTQDVENSVGNGMESGLEDSRSMYLRLRPRLTRSNSAALAAAHVGRRGKRLLEQQHLLSKLAKSPVAGYQRNISRTPTKGRVPLSRDALADQHQTIEHPVGSSSSSKFQQSASKRMPSKAKARLDEDEASEDVGPAADDASSPASADSSVDRSVRTRQQALRSHSAPTDGTTPSANHVDRSTFNTTKSRRVSSSKTAVASLLNGRDRDGLGLEAWEDLENAEQRERYDRAMRAMRPQKSRELDEYDREYDKGRVKKIRQKDVDSNGVLDARVFDEVGRAQIEGKRRFSVQFRGKKKRFDTSSSMRAPHRGRMRKK